jgi:hypothetical protein
MEFTQAQQEALDAGTLAMRRADAERLALDAEYPEPRTWATRRATGRDGHTPAGPFRTATGQTGEDAYTFERAAIANLQRELDRRKARLAQAIADDRAWFADRDDAKDTGPLTRDGSRFPDDEDVEDDDRAPIAVARDADEADEPSMGYEWGEGRENTESRGWSA